MEDYSIYNRKFKSLLESKSGNVKPLLKESDMDFTDQPHFVEEEEWNEEDEMGIDQPHFVEEDEWSEENESWDQDDESWDEEDIKF